MRFSRELQRIASFPDVFRALMGDLSRYDFQMRRTILSPPVLVSLVFLAGCAGSPVTPGSATDVELHRRSPAAESKAQDIVIFALGLLDTGYRFGGKNPEAGLDCSGMVSYVYDKAAGMRLQGSAAELAKRGQRIRPASLQPGDLVFFNVRQQPYSHVGIYIGDGRFVHAPSSNGKVRTDKLFTGWFAERFEEARAYLD